VIKCCGDLGGFLENRKHYGVVLNASKQNFDKGSAAMGSIFRCDDDSKLFLFYSGARDNTWSKSSIGLATSSDGVNFERNSRDPVIEGENDSFCSVQALNPAVTRVKNRFFMVFSGKRSLGSPRTIGLAYADDVEGPWRVIGELIKPSYIWEGNGIDNGCSAVKLDEETLLVFYSSLTTRKVYDVFTLLRRYPVRRIGILKVRVRGTSPSSIEAMRFSGNPLKHLNGSKGSWNESVFCPGYVKLSDRHVLFPAASVYSVGFPWEQHVGMVIGGSPFFRKGTVQTARLIDGSLEKSAIMPGVKGELALDTPSPYFDKEKGKLFLYYSVADRANNTWKIALTTFNSEVIDGIS